jgi:hypothetical protein
MPQVRGDLLVYGDASGELWFADLGQPSAAGAGGGSSAPSVRKVRLAAGPTVQRQAAARSSHML